MLFLLSIYAWFVNSKLVQEHLVLYMFGTGFVFGRLVFKILVGHLTKTRYPMLTLTMIPFYFGALFSNATGFSAIEYPYLVVFSVYAILNYFYWARITVKNFCEFLGIYCFRIGARDRGVLD
jgi:hypothetical protein